ncbi:MAG: hypothetical protein HQ518_22345 [Rhodopirellula sp.]|nr:hypothetical protein [Rhodopirellula sp.]
MRIRTSPLILLVFALSIGIANATDPLKVAKELTSTRYKGWTYGSVSAKNQVDCAQFLLAVVEHSVRATLAPKVRNRILVAELSKEELEQPSLAALVIGNDERTKGVQSALVGARLGTGVGADAAAPGDLIQYWMKKDNETWFGHAGVIQSVDRSGDVPRVKIWGAHATPEPGRIGISSLPLRLDEKDAGRRLYIVRLK